jgi:hypothetical protein
VQQDCYGGRAAALAGEAQLCGRVDVVDGVWRPEYATWPEEELYRRGALRPTAGAQVYWSGFGEAPLADRMGAAAPRALEAHAGKALGVSGSMVHYATKVISRGFALS